MNTNIMIKKLIEGKNIIGETICKFVKDQYESDFEHDWEYHVFYYLGLDGNVYCNFNDGEYVRKAANKLSEYIFDYPGNRVKKGGKHNRKSERLHRVGLMTSHIWVPYGMFGKNRRLRRRMWPNAEDFYNAEQELPF